MTPLRPILLVEDNLKDVELILVALRKSKMANEIVVARDGDEALDYLYRRGKFQSRELGLPAAVFLDLKMPKVDGVEVLRQMKADAVLKLVPVVMLTSSREEVDLATSYELGVNAYVVKPVGFQEFIDVVGQAGMFWAVVNETPPEKERTA
jgi:CheY-like chemotaxis protein